MALLEVEEIETYYGKSHVLHGVSLKIEEGQVVALLGKNGVGKTTTLRSIMGLTPPKRGTIRFKGHAIQGKKPFNVARVGIGFVPEDRAIFPGITVLDNLEIAAKARPDGSSPWSLEKVFKYFPVLELKRGNRGKNLSGGEQQMLTIARTLMGNPELVLLDEPCEGLSPLIVAEIFHLIQNLKKNEGVTILIAEQNMKFCMKVADWGYLIEKGIIKHSASMESINSDSEIQMKFLAL
ncbi:MAG: ABC transporter ATP-binding protein [Desulfomonilaceae bacterium]